MEEITIIEQQLTTEAVLQVEIVLQAETASTTTPIIEIALIILLTEGFLPLQTETAILLILRIGIILKANHQEIAAITHKTEQTPQTKAHKDPTPQATLPLEAVAVIWAVAPECLVAAVAEAEWEAEEDRNP